MGPHAEEQPRYSHVPHGPDTPSGAWLGVPWCLYPDLNFHEAIMGRWGYWTAKSWQHGGKSPGSLLPLSAALVREDRGALLCDPHGHGKGQAQ